MEKPLNPLSLLIKEFHNSFIDQNRLLLYNYSAPLTGFLEDASVMDTFDDVQTNVKRCIRDVNHFKELIKDSVVRMYELCFKGINDPNIELLENLLTSLIIKDELYVFLQCLYTLQYSDEISALEDLFSQNNRQKVDLTFLEVK